MTARAIHERFDVQRGVLVREVRLSDDRSYTHRCERASFEATAHAIDEAGQRGFTLEELVTATGLPHTQVAVAIAFMKERGCVVTERKRNYPATGNCPAPGSARSAVFEDAMIEFTYLDEAPY